MLCCDKNTYLLDNQPNMASPVTTARTVVKLGAHPEVAYSNHHVYTFARYHLTDAVQRMSRRLE